MIGKRVRIVRNLKSYESLGYVDRPEGYVVKNVEPLGIFVKGYGRIILNGDYEVVGEENGKSIL